MKDFKSTQHTELESWAPDNDKIQREKIRYRLLARQMNLFDLDTSEMLVADIGVGPLGGVSSLINCKRVERIDPLMDEYSKLYPQHNGFSIKAEDLKERLGKYDLIIITNALDHFEDPIEFLHDLKKYMKPGAYFASVHAINNSFTHEHEAHAHSLTPEIFHEILDDSFETVWSLTYPDIRYGWHTYNGKIGQPAFSLLMRKAVGYA